MQEHDDDEPQSSPLSKSYNLMSPGQDDILSQLEKEGGISDQLDSTLQTPTNPSHVTPTATLGEPSPFKTPSRTVDQAIEKKMRMKKGTLFHQTSQNLEESPAPALKYRSPSELLLDQDLTHSEGLMKDVQYCINGKINDKVQQVLKYAKAKRTIYPAGTTTHILMGSNPDETMVDTAKVLTNDNVSQVDEDWVMLSCLVGQLLPISEDKFLAGIVACVGDEMNDENRNKIWAMLTWRGAKVVTSLSSEVTHVIANTTLDKLCVEASSIPNIKIVTSDWVVISLKKNSRIDEEEYHPQLLQEEPEGQEDMDIDKNAGKL